MRPLFTVELMYWSMAYRRDRWILAAWGNKGGPEDLDGSGLVDIGDILIVLANWGPCP